MSHPGVRGAVDPVLAAALESWRVRLTSAGIACRAVALHGQSPGWQLEFADGTAPGLGARWLALRSTLDAAQSLAIDRPNLAGQAGSPDVLLACAIDLPGGQRACAGVLLAPPCNDRTVQSVLLSLGWLQQALVVGPGAHGERALKLATLLAGVAACADNQQAAFAWASRTAAWALPWAAPGQRLCLRLFAWRVHRPKLWAQACAETATHHADPEAGIGTGTGACSSAPDTVPALAAGAAQATELATQAGVEQSAVDTPQGWALPVLDRGRTVAVLVAQLLPSGDGAVVAVGQPRATAATAPRLTPPLQAALRDSLALAEPLLRRWQQADRPLWRHQLDAAGSAWRRLTGPGHRRLKLLAALLPVAVLALLLWPVPERVVASTVIEGQVRQLVTAPFDGFFAQVLVRPGVQVRRGQPLARLDTRDLLLEQAKHLSEREQAAAKLRQAMAERDASALALAAAEQQQAQAQLALAEAKLARAELVSPLDGLLVSGDWAQQIGGPVETGKELFEVAAGQGWRVVLHVPDRDIARIAPGQPGELRLTGQPQRALRFRVSTVTATASVQDGGNGFRVEAELLLPTDQTTVLATGPATGPGATAALSPGIQGIGKIEVGRSSLLAQWTRPSLDWLRLKLWALWW